MQNQLTQREQIHHTSQQTEFTTPKKPLVPDESRLSPHDLFNKNGDHKNSITIVETVNTTYPNENPEPFIGFYNSGFGIQESSPERLFDSLKKQDSLLKTRSGTRHFSFCQINEDELLATPTKLRKETATESLISIIKVFSAQKDDRVKKIEEKKSFHSFDDSSNINEDFYNNFLLPGNLSKDKNIKGHKQQKDFGNSDAPFEYKNETTLGEKLLKVDTLR